MDHRDKVDQAIKEAVHQQLIHRQHMVHQHKVIVIVQQQQDQGKEIKTHVHLKVMEHHSRAELMVVHKMVVPMVILKVAHPKVVYPKLVVIIKDPVVMIKVM